MRTIEKKIAILAPLKNIEDMSKRIIKNMDLDIDVVYVDENSVVEIAQEKLDEGKEIIISRGGIANRIRKNIDISVIDIEITGYDILKVLSKYINSKKKIAVVEISKITKNAKKIADSLNLDMKIFNISKIEEFSYAFDSAMEDGAKVILSGSWAIQFEDRYNMFKEKGIVYEVIESGEEAIVEALNNAEKLYEMTTSERRKKEEFQAVLHFIEEGIISVDTEGIIQSINPAAMKIFGTSKGSLIGEKIQNKDLSFNIFLALDTGLNRIGKMGKVEEKKVVFSCIPIVIDEDNKGVVISIQEIERLQAIEHKARLKLSEKGLVAKMTFNDIVGKSDKIMTCINFAQNYSLVDSTILITGESGCGKEIFAQSIHNYSKRKNNPFVAINCAALPTNLLESELFGYVEGAFTGARKKGKIGLFELAHTGTIFLDEIGEIDKKLQTRLLRVIQEKEVMRIGDDKIIPVNVRIIAATNKNLIKEVEEDNFREDLYYRLNVLNISIPPLRERKEDIELLAEKYIKYLCRKFGYTKIRIDNNILETLLEYEWPGNIRELQNIIERILVMKQNDCLLNYEQESFVKGCLINRSNKKSNVDDIDLSQSLNNIEKQIIKKVLEEEDYNKTKAAQRLGINRTTINRKLQSSDA